MLVYSSREFQQDKIQRYTSHLTHWHSITSVYHDDMSAMKYPLSTLISLASTGLASNSTLQPFTIPSIDAYQPNGYPGGQVNYYHLGFSVHSSNSGTLQSGYCYKFWGDNGWTDPVAYSHGVPTTEWIVCNSWESAMDGRSKFQFKMFPYFSIGSFSVEVKEDIGDGKSLYGWAHITNRTGVLACEIDPKETHLMTHANGNCRLAEGAGPLKINTTVKESEKWF
ncbi:hypothetical protein CLAFUW4_12224 [Fulvia fulva]|uniref:Uncharacterized protein n=1 Tax=Passalora fulva TaxID=5499 RepID=A0A9Q8PF40_PASFU|nr:uncharacterized protein CLAFUR5_11254 [Fulvia fulva]KAK4618355.1 hypothetical protein CLAFUR4_12229 [Fulvia fulva]KAK4618720.1 hypothetical protein CLAFUR0_12240 [Fulvia fulva]UJO21300.1 hypothetical protein CLAFUR5_11254 [Fulvia fulva]WPV17916.1 hypothetical protein CLAFUW4_12224 [Fulvia fulva]WPV32960.1 hypothetical protein CLAFUW7_12231 [Fulvia fulva]